MNDKNAYLGEKYLATEGVSLTTATTEEDEGAVPGTHEERSLGDSDEER